MPHTVSPSTIQIVDAFYDAAWDLTESLLVFTSQSRQTPAGIVEGGEPLLNPLQFKASFDKSAAPFLALSGDDLPKETHIFYSEIEDSLQEIVYPKLNVIIDIWQKIYPDFQKPLEKNPSNERALRQFVKDGSIDLRDELEMNCILQAKGLLTELQAMPH